MWELLKHLGTGCWGRHEWISRANSRGLWLECRRCGQESPGLEMPAPRYRQTQSGNEAAQRIAKPAASETVEPRRFGVRLTTRRAPVLAQWPVTAPSAPSLIDAERRWLEAWRAMSPEEQAVAERMVAGLTGVPLGAERADDRLRLAGRARVRSFSEASPAVEGPMAASR